MEGKNVEIVRHDLATEPPSRDLLEELIDEDDVMSYVNTRSPKYKELDLGSRTLTRKEAIDLMMEEPNLIRRPIVLRRKKAVFGVDPEGWDAMLR